MQNRKVKWAYATREYLEDLWDTKKVCRNPHKGFYIHYYDNTIKKYNDMMEPGDFLQDFPGMDHIYLRLAWSYLEPHEGKYDWELIDRVIEPWTQHGYNVAFRITCMESDKEQPFATPEWVMKSGTGGEFIKQKCGSTEEYLLWEPDYGDPVFLRKLENFHLAFAERYGSKPWLEYIDIGSYGVWGEGHTICSCRRDWPVEVIKKHIDLYCRVYPGQLLMIPDEIFNARFYSKEDTIDTQEEILQHVIRKGITLRDDTICVPGIWRETSLNHLRNPEVYELFWPYKPVNLELHHYHDAVEKDAWKQGKHLKGAVDEMHATYIGFHGGPRRFLEENPQLTAELANRCGYWYFITCVEYPTRIIPGESVRIKLVWENHGVAPAYNQYALAIKLVNAETGREHIESFEDSGNRKWMPGRVTGEKYEFVIPAGLMPGKYSLRIALTGTGKDDGKRVELGFKDSIRDSNGFYEIATADIG